MQFNLVSKYYNWLSSLVFGGSLEMAKISLFDRVPEGAFVLIIGGGTGSSLKNLLQLKKNIRVDFVDASEQMVARTKQTVKDSNLVNYVVCPIKEYNGAQYDVIITEFFLDLFSKETLSDLVPFIGSKLKVNATWLDTDFRKPQKKRHQLLLTFMYLFFKITANIEANRLVDVEKMMNKNGLQKLDEVTFKSGFISSRLFQQT